jgi:acid stress-induced BolA-like protein IbaG/YrbA
MNEQIILNIKNHIDPKAEVLIDGSDCSLQVTVISEVFTDCNTIKRHRMINELFKEDILSGKLHALSIKTHTPAEYGNIK